jgi:Glycosyl hydrolase family 3 C-terminal domain/Fibronectin type III-like domain
MLARPFAKQGFCPRSVHCASSTFPGSAVGSDQTNDYTAEVGCTAGGVINVITKTGINSFHGSVCEYFRNDAMDANSFQLGGYLPTTELRQNQYGGSLGGPIKKNKTFFFADYEGFRLVQGSYSGQLQVPSLAQYQAIRTNPSSLLPAGVTTVDPAGLAYAMMYSAPNAVIGGTPYFSASPNKTQYSSTADARVDHHFDENNPLSVRWTYNNVATVIPNPFPNVSIDGLNLNPGGVAFGLEGPASDFAQQFQSNFVHIFGPSQLGIFGEDTVVDPTAKKLAAEADAVIVAAGFDPESETEGGDRTFGLPAGQDELIREIAAENKNTVVVLTSGGAVDTRGWLDHVPALIEAWYPGQSGGIAAADLLLGNFSPSGRLPISYDRSWEENPAHESYYPQSDREVVYCDGIFVGYRGYDHDGKKPLFPFGFGLSYAKFEYSQLTLKATGRDDRDPRYEVSFNVKNTGGRPGTEVAQVYVREKHPRVPRPPKELKTFARLDLKPGETRPALLPLDARSFAYYDTAAKQWRSDPGEFEILIGALAEDIRLRGTVSLSKPSILP